MKFFLLASFVIFCTASTVYRSRNISVNDDGNILITSPNGKRVVIAKQIGPNGEKNIDISISGPNIPTKTIQVKDNTLEDVEIAGNLPFSSIDSLGDEYRLKRGGPKSQSQILSEIVREYQGVVTEPQYEKLLNKINKAVKKGELSPQIYDLLEELDQQQQIAGVQGNLVLGQGGLYGQGQTQGQLYGSGLPIVGSGYGATVLVGPQGQSQLLLTSSQLPSSWYPLGKQQYLATTPNVNPLLTSIYQNSYINGLLATQPLGVQGIMTGSPVIPQSYGLGTTPRLLQQLLGYQQIPYGQIVSGTTKIPQLYGVQQTVGQLGGVPQTIGQLYGTSQTVGQLTGVPQSILQQQIEQLNEVEQVMEQLSEVQEQLLQQQQFGQAAQVQDVIEQINQIQQQQPIVQLPQPVVQQLLGQQPIVQQQPVVVQSGGLLQPIGQQLLRQGQSIVQQQPMVSQLQGLPPQVVQQVLQQGLPQQQLLGQQVQPLVQLQRSIGQLQSYPVSLQKLLGIPQVSSFSQPMYGGLPIGQSGRLQGRTGIYLNTVPQVQVY